MSKALVTLLISSFYLLGCAAAFVPESNSSKTKINQTSALFNQQGRPVAAVKLFNQAISLAQKEGDKLSEADAHFYLAEVHKYPGKNGATVKDPKKAIEHHEKAIALYDELKFYKRAAFVSWNASGAYEQTGDKKGLCRSLGRAAQLHEKAGGSPQDALPSPYDDGNLLKSIRHLQKEKKCS